MRKSIYKFYCDFGRMGELSGVFAAHPEKIFALIGKSLYFGEVLGKHSEVVLTLKAEHLTFVTDDPKFVELFEKYDLETGINPLSVIIEEEYYDDE